MYCENGRCLFGVSCSDFQLVHVAAPVALYKVTSHHPLAAPPYPLLLSPPSGQTCPIIRA